MDSNEVLIQNRLFSKSSRNSAPMSVKLIASGQRHLPAQGVTLCTLSPSLVEGVRAARRAVTPSDRAEH